MKIKHIFGSLTRIFLLVLLFACSYKESKTETKTIAPNILFIPVDDLRPEFGAYGNNTILTPNMDRLATEGVTFMRAYCQQAVCNPSRASLLTGLRPDSIQVWDLRTDFRKNVPDVVTLPQYFKKKGYTSIGLGKTFHNNDPDTISWSIIPENIAGFPFDPDAVYINEDNLEIQQMKIRELKAAGRSSIDQLGHWYVKAKATENADVDDDAYYDGAQTSRAIEILRDLKTEGKPFFLSVGYYRPHLPFNAPKKYWDMYQRSEIPLAANQFVPRGSPAYLVHGEAELRGYSDCRDLPLPSEEPWDKYRQREIKHGYFASVSYTDAQIGRLLDELERLNLADNTIVVLWGDHGWKLGEHNGWCKQSNYEIDTRVPLIISGYGVAAKGKRSSALCEFVDIYPTLCEMADLPVPGHLQGTSLDPLLKDPDLEWKTAAYSQFLLGRFGRTKTVEGEQMGYAIRTDRYRYVEWFQWDAEGKKAEDLLHRELFDHLFDPQENINLAADPAMVSLVDSLALQLDKGWRHSRPGDYQSHAFQK
jgi:arylsulfatase A-like enzyme